uniref:Uncharacterized protein n=1 Tax=Anguilla anguilla TaxID=7936 RepID=A0A0E9WXF7_ANGAN
MTILHSCHLSSIYGSVGHGICVCYKLSTLIFWGGPQCSWAFTVNQLSVVSLSRVIHDVSCEK